MGLQIPLGVDYEVPVPGLGRARGAAGQRTLAGDCSESGDDDLRWGDQSGARAYARIDTPQVSVSRAVQFRKGKSWHRLPSEFAALTKRYLGQNLCAGGYWVASSGNVSDEVYQKYIENQVPEEPDENLQIV